MPYGDWRDVFPPGSVRDPWLSTRVFGCYLDARNGAVGLLSFADWIVSRRYWHPPKGRPVYTAGLLWLVGSLERRAAEAGYDAEYLFYYGCRHA